MRAFFAKILGDIKRAPLWVWIGGGLTLILIYFAWRQSRSGGGGGGGGVAQDSSAGGGGAVGGLPLPTAPSASDLPSAPSIPLDLLPLPPTPGSPNGSSGGGGVVAALGRMATDIRSNYGPAPLPSWLTTFSPPASGVSIGHGSGAAIQNPTAASQLAHLGRSVPAAAVTPLVPAQLQQQAPHPVLTFRYRQANG